VALLSFFEYYGELATRPGALFGQERFRHQAAFKFFSFLWLVTIIGCSSNQSVSSSKTALAIIANPHVATNELIQALKVLRDSKVTNEPPQFWTAIANSPKYSCDHRQRAALQLLARHFRRGMTFGDIGRLLDHPNWIDRHGVGSGPATGPGPPGVNDMDGLALAWISCGGASSARIFFRFTQGYMGTAADLYWCLEGKPTNQELDNVRIVEVISCEHKRGLGWIYNAWGIPP
jgi:hypothetical protein